MGNKNIPISGKITYPTGIQCVLFLFNTYFNTNK